MHDNPTSSYLWRNIIPYAARKGRVITLDLISISKSDKPDNPYRFGDHVPFVEGLIKALGPKDITLVIHSWVSALRFHYARRHPESILHTARDVALSRALCLGPQPQTGAGLS